MEQSVIDLKKVEEVTNKKIKAANLQKVTIVAAIVDQVKVWNILFWISTNSSTKLLSISWL